MNTQLFLNKKTSSTQRQREAEVMLIDSVFWSLWGGFIPIPWADTLYSASIQLKMIHEICVVYDIPFSKHRAEALVAALGAGAVNGIFAYFAIRAAPGLGSAATIALLATTTYTIGQMLIAHFEAGGDLYDFEIDDIQASTA